MFDAIAAQVGRSTQGAEAQARGFVPAADPERQNAQIGGLAHIVANVMRKGATGYTGEDLRNITSNPTQRKQYPFLERYDTAPSAEEARVTSAGKGQPGLKGDKAMHALANYKMAERLGPRAAEALGYLQELPTAVLNRLSEGKFKGAHGWSEEDLIANAVGRNEQARDRPALKAKEAQALLRLVRYLGGGSSPPRR
jgi:hypothetical protein